MKIKILFSIFFTLIIADEPGEIMSDSREVANVSVRIFGGTNAIANQFPYQAGLKFAKTDTAAFCGGALISQNYVLTAAQCVDGATTLIVVLGALDISDITSGVSLLSTQFIYSPKYGPADLEYDIALIRLPTTVAITPAIRPIWLPIPKRAVDVVNGQIVIVSGWGIVDDFATDATILQFLRAPVISREDCQSVGQRKISQKNICTSGVNGVGTCLYDSGDPLVATVNGVTRLVGIASFGLLACDQNYPSVYSRVSSHYKWIIKNTDVDPLQQI